MTDDRSAIHAYMTTPEAEHRFAVAFKALSKALNAEEKPVGLIARERLTLAVLTALDEDSADQVVDSGAEVPGNSTAPVAH